MVFFPIFMKLSVVYAASLCTFVRFETMTWPEYQVLYKNSNFKSLLNILSTQMLERKRSEEYLVIILVVKRKLWAICLPWVDLARFLYMSQDFQRHFTLNTVLSSVVNENCCLCKSFTELCFLSWLLVVSFAILIAVQVVSSRTWKSYTGVLKMPRTSNAFINTGTFYVHELFWMLQCNSIGNLLS